MKRRDDRATSDGSFAEKMRERLARGTDAARRMIDRVRELATHGPSPSPMASAAPAQPVTKSTDEPSARDAARTRSTTATQATAAVTGHLPSLDEAGEEDSDEIGESVEISPQFATTTMGEILLKQGHARDAAVVFEKLIARNPGNTEARTGLTRARAAQGIVGVPGDGVNAPEPSEMLDRVPPPVTYHVSEARALPVDPHTIVVFWELTTDAIERARHEVGEPSTCALMISSMRQGADGFEQTDRVISDVAQTGDYFVHELPSGATHHAAVGLRSNERFAAIVHAEAVSTPRGSPSSQIARIQATVAVPPRVVGRSGDAPQVTGVQLPHVERMAVTAAASTGRLEVSDVARGAERPVPEASRESPMEPVEFPPFGACTPKSMPSSIDMALRARDAAASAGNPGGPDAIVVSTSSGQWSSSGQWTPADDADER